MGMENERNDVDEDVSPRPWDRHHAHPHQVRTTKKDAVFELTYGSEADIEHMLRAVNERDALLALLRKVEWVECETIYGHTDRECPICGCWKETGHAPDCQLAAALAPTPPRVS